MAKYNLNRCPICGKKGQIAKTERALSPQGAILALYRVQRRNVRHHTIWKRLEWEAAQDWQNGRVEKQQDSYI